MYNVGQGAPFLYDYVNMASSSVQPSGIHVNNTGLNRYFQRYLMQKAISVFEWNIPETWAKNYFLYVLYSWGYIAVFETDRYGVIPQGCGLRGYDIFYQPTHATISNPLLKGIIQPRIGKQCEIIKLQPDYNGIMDIVNYYSNLMALVTETLGTNLLNTKLSYIFGAENKAQADSFKKMFDEVASGKPAVFVDKNLFDDNGKPKWFTFENDLKQNYLGDELLTALRKIDAMFDNDIGIPNANTDKKERLIVDEVNANNFETRSKCELWLESLKDGCEKVNNMFGIDLSVDWRKEVHNNGVNIDTINI